MFCETGGPIIFDQKMKIRIRTPVGGESQLVFDDDASVEDLRLCVNWCIENKEWNTRVMPPNLSQGTLRKQQPQKVADEMWSLNEPIQTHDECKVYVVSDESVDDLESTRVFTETHDIQRSNTQLLFGTQILEVRTLQPLVNG
jgi:hypothetical protein